MGTALAASALALTLVAAQAPAVPAVGTASTAMTAVELAVTGAGELPALTVLDGGTFASTDTDATRNVRGGGLPFAATDLVPLLTGDTPHGATSVSAREGESENATSTQQTAGGDALGAVVDPIRVEAAAAADTATATVAAATARINGLAEALGISVDSAGIVSQVTRHGATASQGLTVSGLDLDLGDLLPADVLAILPVDVLLQLLEQLPVGAPDVQAVVDEILAAVGSVEDVTDQLDGATADLDTTVNALAAALQRLASADSAVRTLEGDLVDAEAAESAARTVVAEAQAAVDALAGLTTAVGAASSCLGSLDLMACIAGLQADAAATLEAAQATLAEATATVDTVTAALADAVAALEPIADTVDSLTDAASALVALVVELVDQLVDTLGTLLASLTDLTGSLDGIVAALAESDVVSIGELDLGVNAAAAGSEEHSSASVVCAPVPVRVAGRSLGTADCSSPLTGASSALAGALAALEGVFGSLPIAGDVVPDVSLEVFPTVTESVTTVDGYVTSTAQVVAMDLDLPSVTLDPTELVDGLLADLSVDLVDGLLASLPAGTTLAEVGLGELAGQLDGVRALLDTTVVDLQAQLGDVLAQLPDGSQLGTVTTPGVAMLVDPTSTATFRSGAPASGSPAPDGDGPDRGTLPTTGGGAILLGGLALLGAGVLGRRRW